MDWVYLHKLFPSGNARNVILILPSCPFLPLLSVAKWMIFLPNFYKIVINIVKKFQKGIYKVEKVWYNTVVCVSSVFGYEAVKQLIHPPIAE